MHEKLAFVVVCAAGIDGFLAGCRIFCDYRLEGIGAPFFQRLRRLYVVVAIHQDGFIGPDVLAAKDYRMAFCGKDFGFIGPGFFQKFCQARCAAVHVVFMLRLGAHRRNAKQRKQLLEEALLILLDVGFHA